MEDTERVYKLLYSWRISMSSRMNYHDRCYRKWFLQYHAV